MDDLIVFMLDIFMFILILSVAVWFFQRMRQKNTGTVAVAQQSPADTSQLVEDIKMIKTTSVSDAISVLDDLGSTTDNYRHYCELIGKSQSTGGVTAPYSKRQVAYYDLRCYRIESRDGRDVETLVAHEKSIDPFWFSDNDGASQIYVDLDTFGNNVILVNATNRVEGPNSDFTKALTNAVQDANGGSRMQRGYAMVGRGVQAAHNVLAGTAQGARLFGNAVFNMFGVNRMQPAYVGVTVTQTPTRTEVVIPPQALGSNIKRADKKSGLYGGFGFGGIGMGGIPLDLDDFLEGAFSGGRVVGYGGPKFRPSSGGELLGIGLGALLSTLATATPTTTTGQPRQQDSFRGYRLIEDVVPLGSPIYTLGEIYRHGSDVHIGKSISDSYPSSYFATKSEAEVLSSLK